MESKKADLGAGLHGKQQGENFVLGVSRSTKIDKVINPVLRF